MIPRAARVLTGVAVLLAAIASHATYAAGALNVSIAVFDPGVPADQSLHRDLGIFPRIREIEAKLLPFALRDQLAEAGGWGAIRVIPEPDAAAAPRPPCWKWAIPPSPFHSSAKPPRNDNAASANPGIWP